MAVQIARFALINIEVDAQNKAVRHGLAFTNLLDISFGYHLTPLRCLWD
jgi:hypothetical protein